MQVNFTKMHGIGNDYIYVNCLHKELDCPSKLAIEMSKRHFSVGADGLIMICSSFVADAKMRMFNADGSEGKMCGNAIRCVAKYLYDNKLTEKTELQIETLSGIRHLKLNVQDGKVKTVTVDMGKATFEPSKIPANSDSEIIQKAVTYGKKEYKMTALSVGNPHAVIFTTHIENIDLQSIGDECEKNPLFLEGVNTEFAETIGRRMVKMRVWERGSGETFACGTGASAVVAAGCKTGILDFDTPVTVKLIGGELEIVCKKDFTVYMTGSATKIYDGVYEYED